mgnify:CR=1 FL=1
MDTLRIHEITATGYHGVFAHERENGQRFSASVTLGFSQSAVGRSDALEDTVDYAQVVTEVLGVLTGPPLNTIEAIAARIAETVLRDHARVEFVEVAVTKPEPPVEAEFGGVTATIRRERKE